MLKTKEKKMLRLYLDEFTKETQEGAWLWELNPDNVDFIWYKVGKLYGGSVGGKIWLNPMYQAYSQLSREVPK